MDTRELRPWGATGEALPGRRAASGDGRRSCCGPNARPMPLPGCRRAPRCRASCWRPSKAPHPCSAFRRGWCMRSTGCSVSPSRRIGSGAGGRSYGLRRGCSRNARPVAGTGQGDQPAADRARPRQHERQPERQALRPSRPSEGAHHRSLRLRSVAAGRTVMPNFAVWRSRARRSAPLWAGCAGARRSPRRRSSR